MTQITYQATSLRSLVKQMMPSAESKNIPESQYCYLGARVRRMECEDGTSAPQCVLVAETDQPTFDMALSLMLSTDEVQVDDTVVRVNTRDLDTALASCGQQMVTVFLHEDGTVQLLCQERDEDGQPYGRTKCISVRGEKDELMEDLTAGRKDCCQLGSMKPLLDGLHSVVGIAAVRGNALSRQGVFVTLEPDSLCLDGTNPNVLARATYASPWFKAPRYRQTGIISTDAARHLVSALSFAASQGKATAPVGIAMDDTFLYVETEGMTFCAEVTHNEKMNG